MNAVGTGSRLRDTNAWYEDLDPLSIVDPTLIEFIHANAGLRILDFGSGPGGYSRRLNDLGHSCCAIDINRKYVGMARALGVEAVCYDGCTIPLADKSVDTVIAIEVLEHLADPARLVSEIERVACRNFIATVPNCTQNFGGAPVVFDHMLDADHKNFFTIKAFRDVLSTAFPKIEIRQIVPVNESLATAILPGWLSLLYKFALKTRVARQSHYFRLLAHATL
jgi:SAM-dependent methyltransferase